MEKPNVVLKKVKTFQGHEGYGLNAEVWIDGVYCTFVIDDGSGDCLDLQHNFRLGSDNHNAMIKERIKLLEDYIATLPDITTTLGGEKPFTYKQDLESYINQLVYDMENEKSKKKMVKLFETAIVIGVPNSNKYNSYRQTVPLSTFKTSVLQHFIDNVVKTKCVGDVQILNTNLKELGITI